MAISRVTGPQLIRNYTGANFPKSDASPYELQRLDTGKMVAVWSAGSSTTETLDLTTLSALGTSPTAIQTLDTVDPSRTLDLPVIAPALNGGFLVVWDNDTSGESDPFSADALGRLFNAAGTPTSAKFALSIETSGGEFTPAVARLGNGSFFTTWSDTRTSLLASLDVDALGRIFGQTGAPAGSELKVNISLGDQLGADALGLPDGRAVAIWANATVSPALEITFDQLRFRFISPTGAATGPEFTIDTIAPGSSYLPFDGGIDALGLGNGGFVVVWQQAIDPDQDGEIHFQRFSPSGAKIGAEVVVENATDHIVSFQAVELANGGFAIAWRTFDESTSTGGDFIRVFDMNGAEIGAETSLQSMSTPGLSNIFDLELMSNGRVLALGTFGSGNSSVGTQVFDFGDERLLGTALANTLFGKEGVNDQILGLAGSDKLTGLSGNDTLDGGANVDTLIGGLGRDTMTGGTERDIFDFNAIAETGKGPATRDVIKDFVHLTDDIDLSTIDANGAAAGNAFSFLPAMGAAFTGVKGQLHWLQAAGKTIVEGDIDGNKVADFQIELTGLVTLTSGDFIL